MKLLSTQQRRALTWAVDKVDTLREYFTDDIDTTQLVIFDTAVFRATEALKIIGHNERLARLEIKTRKDQERRALAMRRECLAIARATGA